MLFNCLNGKSEIMLKERKLNLACGRDYKDGWINVDVLDDESRRVKPDLVLDLLVFPWSIRSNYYEYVLLSHYIEHLPHLIEAEGKKQDALVRTMKEVHRILVPGGIVEIRVPDCSDIISYFNTPTHYRIITEGVIKAFTHEIDKPITFDSSFRFDLIESKKQIQTIDAMIKKVISRTSLCGFIIRFVYNHNVSLSEKLYSILLHIRFAVRGKRVKKELIIKLKKHSAGAAAKAGTTKDEFSKLRSTKDSSKLPAL